MYKQIIFSIVVVCFFCGCSKDESLPNQNGYYPVPKNIDFPVSSSKINEYIHNQNMSKIRQHGWDLFIGLNKQVAIDNQWSISLWQTWYSVTQVFAKKGTDTSIPAYRKLHNTTEKPFSPHPTLKKIKNIKTQNKFAQQIPTYTNDNHDGTIFANNGDIMIAGEYFSAEAIKHIRDKELYRQSVLSQMLTEGKKTVPEFPQRAIVLKSMHWPVAADQMTALPVWDNDPNRPPYEYNGYETWKRAVAIDPKRHKIPQGEKATLSTLYGVKVPGFDTPRKFNDARVVSLQQFYHIKITEKLWERLDDNDKQILHQSAQWAYNRKFRPGDYIALIAFHINTKEIGPWTMQSFWWHDAPHVGPFSENRPQKPGVWRNYLMTTTYNQITPREYDATPHVGYNPYIELVIHPIPTNCQNCHARAAYPHNKKQLYPPQQKSFAKYNDTPQGRNKVDAQSPELKGVLRTDYLWTIPDRAIQD